MSPVQSVRQCEGPEPSLGPVLPRVPSHLAAAAAADKSGATVREPQAADVPRPGTRRAGQLHPRSAGGQDSSDTELSPSDHFQAAASQIVHQR